MVLPPLAKKSPPSCGAGIFAALRFIGNHAKVDEIEYLFQSQSIPLPS